MQTRSRTDMGIDASRKSARRPLFPEEPSNTKKRGLKDYNIISTFYQLHIKKQQLSMHYKSAGL